MKRKILGLLVAASLAFTACIYPEAGVQAAGSSYAEPATELELSEADNLISRVGINLQLINGELYVWGLNNNGRLGLADVSPGTVVAEPTKINKSYFSGKLVKKVFSTWNHTFAVTTDGTLFGWGANYGMTAAPQAATTDDVTTPTEVTFFNQNNLEVLDVRPDINAYTVAAKAKNRTTGEINWYTWGSNNSGEALTGNDNPIDQPTVVTNVIPGETIKDIQIGYHVTAVLTESGKVFGAGSNAMAAVGNNWGITDTTGMTDLTDFGDVTGVATEHSAGRLTANVFTPVQLDFKGKKIKSLQNDNRCFSAIDEENCVWTWGSSEDSRLGLGLGKQGDPTIMGENTIYYVGKPVKVFGSNSVNPETATKTARKIIGGCSELTILCSDNSVFAFGMNNGYRIYNGEGKENFKSGYPYPTQILESISKKETITNVLEDTLSFTVMTRSGNRYFVGSNQYGGIGDGETSSDTTTGNEPTESAPGTLPPVKPTTANKVYLDIVYPNRDKNGELNTISGAAWDSISAKVDAGQKFTVKVYFEDFAKLDQFTLPISFTSNMAKVVYKSGSSDGEYKAYTGDENEARDSSNIISFGANTGLQSNVRESTWPGGELVKNDLYPRVNNAKGYVSVKGITRTNNAPIKGKQLMYSIDFIGTAQGTVKFDIMNAEQTKENGDPLLADESLGATWQIVRQLNGGDGLDLESFFEFNADYKLYFPTVDVRYNQLKSIALDMYYQKDSKLMNIEDTSEEEKADSPTDKRTYYQIDKKDTDTVYVIKALPQPTNATDADISQWSITFDDFTGKNPTDKEVSDYIQVVQSGTKSYTIKVPEATSTTKDGYFVISAKRSDITIEPIYLKVSSMVPPESITIKNADDCPNPFLVKEDKYAVSLGLYNEFTFNAFVKDFDDAPTGNLNVRWTLYNCVDNEDGTTTETIIANNDLTAPAVIVSTGAVDKEETLPGGGKETVRYQTAKVAAQRTTPDKSYVKIKCVSTAGDTVFDESTFRVELLSTGIVTNNQIFIGKNSSRPLSLTAEPFDAYKPEYEIKVANDSPAALSEHGSYISVNADGVVIAGNEFYEGDEDIYDEIIIREKKSDGYFKNLPAGNDVTVKRIKVYVLNILPPPDMDVEAQNNVGVLNDKVVFNADLKVGDGLKIYKSFMDDSTLVKEYTALTASDIAQLKEGFNFVDNDTPSNSGLSGTGGTVGYLVTRSGENFTQVPVSYSAEPCMLTGYARLEGKLANSPKNMNISVEIQGLRDADGNPIAAKRVEDETGYFEFENYVPVGSYTIKLSCDLYITRYVTVTVTGTSDVSDIVVSTVDSPIYLAPGDLGNPKNGKEDPAEFNTYLYSWVGKSGGRGGDARFDDYNFAEPAAGDNVIGMYDVSLMLRYYNRDHVYKDWSIRQ